MVVAFNAQLTFPFGVEKVLVGFWQIFFFDFVGVVSGGPNVQRDARPVFVSWNSLVEQVVVKG